MLASLLPLGYAFVFLKDFKDPSVTLWTKVLLELVLALVGLTALVAGVDLLRFAVSGRSLGKSGWVRPLLLGIGLFFPGFVFSLPIALFAVWRSGHRFDKSSLPFEASACIGLLGAIIGTTILLGKRAVINSALLNTKESSSQTKAQEF